MHFLLEYCGQIWVNSLRNEAVRRILSQPKEWFEKEDNKTSNLTMCLDRNAEEMRNLVGRFAGFIFVATVIMVICIIWGIVVCWKLTLVGFACVPIVYSMTRAFERVSILASSLGYSTKDILTVFSLLLFSLSNVNAALEFVPQISSSRDTARRVLRLTTLPKGFSHEDEGKLEISHPTPLKFTNVNFSYPSRPNKLVLRNLNLTLTENSCIAIVGPSGCGKSTLASLLTALYPVTSSQIGGASMLSVGGNDIQKIHTPTLRSLISIVPQQPTLFPSSVKDNISYGLDPSSPLNTIHNIRSAARAAGIDEFITSLPEGYDTIIGDGGLSVSGGQAQRVVIARALVRKPRMLVLDEATSNLDVHSAEQIRRTVKDLLMGNGGQLLTVIIITHAVEMMEIADRVVVVDKGCVVEEGPFLELMGKAGGELRRLVMLEGKDGYDSQ
ncbi:hypothetical protein HCAG_07068 [Histoplasma mississippiense (nom. inval.)]|uniref:hypothetical protein n=1 Tax=Ajellomyces capsulatus (strain NAm1 / WU24) TaxID=2059318 RepID=UPI000157CD2A|nr:hypothetical protein HCAG_07068 [Histoplasma mississippiense (nom. inval.)]EDN10607.1 hypothetical protein HCAG_07068 [Histoplasma mississippiense (nom. inval.)]